MGEFIHLRHKPPTPLGRERELAVVCVPLRSNVNLSRLIRTASCAGITRIIACGRVKVDHKIARVDPGDLKLEVHRSVEPILKKLRQEAFQLVGLEQTSGAECLYDFAFERRTALVIGNERLGLSAEILQLLDRVVEIPVYGLPYSYNVSTAAAMAVYEYCRQYPQG